VTGAEFQGEFFEKREKNFENFLFGKMAFYALN
jgi:hypothetical protein